MFKTYISEMAGFQFAGAELDMTESTVGDAFVGILHVFLCPFTEVKALTVSSVFSHSSNDLELSLCPSKVGGMMRTGGMTKGLLGFIGTFGVIYSVRRRRRRRLPGLLM